MTPGDGGCAAGPPPGGSVEVPVLLDEEEDDDPPPGECVPPAACGRPAPPPDRSRRPCAPAPLHATASTARTRAANEGRLIGSPILRVLRVRPPNPAQKWSNSVLRFLLA